MWIEGRDGVDKAITSGEPDLDSEEGGGRVVWLQAN